MPDKKQILNSIAAVARRLGHTPSRQQFYSRSGISPYFILRFFPTWSAALRAAGLRPYSLNARAPDRALLEDWGLAARKNIGMLKAGAKIPRHIYLRDGNYNPLTLAKRFGRWTSVPAAFLKFAKRKPEWGDVVGMIPAPAARLLNSKAARTHAKDGSVLPTLPQRSKHSLLKDRALYGNPTNFLGLRHE